MSRGVVEQLRIRATGAQPQQAVLLNDLFQLRQPVQKQVGSAAMISDHQIRAAGVRDDVLRGANLQRFLKRSG